MLELLLCKSFLLSTAIEPRDKEKKVLFGLADFFCLHLLVCFGNRFQRGLKRKPMALIKKLRKAVSYIPLCIIKFRASYL